VRFHPTAIGDVLLVEPTVHADERGVFMKTFSRREFARRGLNEVWPECNLSSTRERGSIRGMHYQASPHQAVKLVRCSAGVVYDVVVDLRRHSPTYCRWWGVELSPENNWALYVPVGVAHGFQCMTDDCRVFYQMSEPYYPDLARGVRWNDPAVSIEWPLAPTVISERDRRLPTADEALP
jgi:dTDP-4-dehydrorhamnose 3,5-epimerase